MSTEVIGFPSVTVRSRTGSTGARSLQELERAAAMMVAQRRCVDIAQRREDVLRRFFVSPTI
jgi:hypothetical protein